MIASGVGSGGIGLSVVTPAHDEAPNLERLLREVRAALDPTGIAWELIVVDDGSTDETPRCSPALAATDAARSAAHLADPQRSDCGARSPASRRRAPTADRDPRRRPAVSARRAAGAARGARRRRPRLRHPCRSAAIRSPRRVASALLEPGVRRLLLAPRVRDLACPLRVFRAAALARVEAVTPLFDGAHRWLPALFVLAGLRVVQRPVAAPARARPATSKYTTTRPARSRSPASCCTMLAPRAHALARLRARRRRSARLALVALPYPPRPRRVAAAWSPTRGATPRSRGRCSSSARWSVPYFNYLPVPRQAGPALLADRRQRSARSGVSEFAARLPVGARRASRRSP